MVTKWIGLAEVRSCRGHDVLDGANGAFVNIVAIAEDAEAFGRLTKDTLNENNLELLSLKDISSVESRIASDQILPELVELSEALTEEHPIQFDEFQAYEEE